MVDTYEYFKSEIFKMTRIDLTAYKERQMKRRIDSLIAKNQIDSYDDYVYALKTNSRLYEEFINYLTINVSEFFRNFGQWEVLEKDIIPMLYAKTRSLKIWSAACSTGEEPYSLTMMFLKDFPLESFKIIATDIDKEVLMKAQAGVYSARNIESMSNDYLNRFFVREGETYRIKDDVKKFVEFKHHNLLLDSYPQDCDLIVCRNVLIYFTEEAKVEIYKKFNKALKPGGILFVGSTEQIILSNKYKFNPIKTFFYQKEGEI